MKRFGLIACLAAGACNIQLVEPESIAVDAPRYHLGTLPRQPSQNDEADPTAVWAAEIRRNLAFLTDPALEGRRPGTEGAELTSSAIISLFGDGGLIPSAPTLGWTTPLGIRTVEVVEPRIAITLPVGVTGSVDGAALPPEPAVPPERIEVTEGLWLRHRGAAGTFHLPMEVVALAPQTDLADRLAVGLVPVLGDDVIEPETRLNGIFDAVALRHPGGCVLQLPPERTPNLQEAAKHWGGAHVQVRAINSEPPQALAIEGFVSPDAFGALRRAIGVPGSTVDVSFKAEERRFEDSNVVGRIAGRENPEQVVLITANWDAGGLAPPSADGGEAQAASGLAVMLAVVERMSLLRQSGRVPSRSVVFVAAAGGSLGNLGLEQLAREGLAHPENIVAVVHLDRLDWTAPTLTVVGGHRSTVGERVQALLPTAELIDHEPGYGHLVFDLPRVPRVTLTRRGGSAPDKLDPSVPLVALANTARITFDLVWDLSDTPDVPEVILPRLDTPDPVPAPEPPTPADTPL